MAVKKFKFVSPGVFIDEVDNSQLPRVSDAVGPVIIGRAPKGPAMRPVTVNSFSEFVDVFGAPVAGGTQGDVWREGNQTAPIYAMYAAQAWLKNSSPLTYVRLLGEDHRQATTAGKAGWETVNSDGDATAHGTTYSDGGAYGLFIIPSGALNQEMGAAAAGRDNLVASGALAAVWYVNQGSVTLKGETWSLSGAAHTVTGNAILLKNVGNYNEFRLLVKDSNGNTTKNTTFNFNRDSHKYIRKVFNTNPILTNGGTGGILPTNFTTESYWLGETFDRHIQDTVGGGTSGTGSSGTTYGVILGLGDRQGTSEWQKHREGKKNSQTGWIISQDLRTTAGNLADGEAAAPQGGFDAHNRNHTKRLFRFHGLDGGEWTQNNLKISISDIKASTNKQSEYGYFNVLVRKIEDNDSAVRIVERFNDVTLDPNSPSYIAKKIGNQYVEWNDQEKRYVVKGDYPNQSSYVYVEMDTNVADYNPQLLPFGFEGEPQLKGFTINASASIALHESASWSFNNVGQPSPEDVGTDSANTEAFLFVKGGGTIADSFQNNTGHGLGTNTPFVVVHTGTFAETSAGGTGVSGALGSNYFRFTGSVIFPQVAYRSTTNDKFLSNPQQAYWGFDTRESDSTTRFEKSNIDILRALPVGMATASYKSYSEARTFTLDDISGSRENGIKGNVYVWASGSRNTGQSITAISASWKGVLDLGMNKFTMPLWGGFDGLDITEKDPFRNRGIASTATETTSYALYSLKKGIDTVRDPEVVEMNLASVPGVWNTNVTEHLINVCEDRGDAMAVIDIEGGYEPVWEDGSCNEGDVTTTVNNLKARALNTSYACAYYPWVQVRDTLNGAINWMPPSVVALGTFASSERRSELWFAPAGFTRGGLTEGSAGLPVLAVKERLTSKQRDELYGANINPIASFPAEGIVIFGQKTLQVTQSALDRINVRRLMIFVKKEISRIAATTLFEPNVKQTWTNFSSRVVPFLDNVKSRLGLTDYKLVLDETTTTPDLVDRNIMYAKIFLKPARTIEFIALDFVITNTGAAFED